MSQADARLQFFATCAKNLEPMVFQELIELGFEQVKQTAGGCRFNGTLKDGYKACLWLRSASRVLLLLGAAETKNARDLVAKVSFATDWTAILGSQQTFVVQFTGQNHAIRNTQFGAQLIKDAVVDAFQRNQIERPNIDKNQPDIVIRAHLNREQLSWYLDLSGTSLHQRGYRTKQGLAPLRETLAAAVAMRALAQQPQADLVLDPFCGAGTLLFEAAMQLLDYAPGLLREQWGFDRWQGHDAELWQSELALAHARLAQAKKQLNTRFIGSDIDPKAIEMAKENAENLGLSELFSWSVANAEHVTIELDQAKHPLLLANPPYAERLGEEIETLLLYRRLGQHLREHFHGWQVALISGDESLLKQLRCRSERKYRLLNGAIESTLALYDLTKEQIEFTKIQSEDFPNRLKKNQQKLKKWANKQGLDAWRWYDADLPEYNVAIDVYNDYVVIQEYAAPKDVPASLAQERLWYIVNVLAETFAISPDKMVLKTRQRQVGKRQYEKLKPRGLITTVHEQGALFEVNLSDYLDTGLFLDHRFARAELQRLSQSKDVLNLFAYTCSASVYAALGGANSVVSVDMSRTYLEWGERNFRLNQINPRAYEFIQADCLTWLGKQRPQQRFDVVFVDPPTFSNSKRMDATFDVQRDHVSLIKNVCKLLKDDGIILFSNNKRKFKLDYAELEALGLVVEDLTAASISTDFVRNKGIHHLFKLYYRD